MAALKSCDRDELRQLLSSGADLNSPGRMISGSELEPQVPSYPLMWAVTAGDSIAVKILLDGGADPNISCEYAHGERDCWMRPLCEANEPDIVTMLLDAGADVNAQTRSIINTDTALMRAADFRPDTCIGDVLIERGADVNMKDESGVGALFRAIAHRNYELADRLLQVSWRAALIARFMGPTWGPSGADRTQVGPMLAPWTLLSGISKSTLTKSRSSIRSVSVVPLNFCTDHGSIIAMLCANF